MILAIHLHPGLTLPVAGVLFAWMTWYWLRLGGECVPASRRKIRRISLVLMLAALPMFVRVLSFEGRMSPREYVVTWSMALLLMVLIIVVAGLDAMNNMRLLQRQANQEMADSARDLVKALQARRGGLAVPPDEDRDP